MSQTHELQKLKWDLSKVEEGTDLAAAPHGQNELADLVTICIIHNIASCSKLTLKCEGI